MKAKEKITLATLKVLDAEADPVELQFNPSELSFSRNADWDPNGGKNSVTQKPSPSFMGAKPDTLKFKILFDQTVVGAIELADAGGFQAMITKAAATAATRLMAPLSAFPAETNDNDVTDQLVGLYALTVPAIESVEDESTNRPRPPIILFEWGTLTFLGVITDLETEVLVVDATGTIKRATVEVTMWGEVLSGTGKTPADFYSLEFAEKNLADALEDLRKGNKSGSSD